MRVDHWRLAAEVQLASGGADRRIELLKLAMGPDDHV